VIGAGQVRRLFTLTGMDTMLEVYPSLGDALAEQTAPQDRSGPAADLPGGVSEKRLPVTSPPHKTPGTVVSTCWSVTT
jgi:hypothetical protein